MDNKFYELAASNNMQFIAGISRKKEANEMYEMKVWQTNNMREISVLFVYYDWGGERFAISDDGKYVATAQYERKLYIYEVESGKNVFECVALRQIQWVRFGDCETLMVGTESSGIFVFDLFSETYNRKIRGRKYFGENILLKDENKIVYRGRNFKSSTFAYLAAIETTRGIIVSEVGGDLYYYDNEGQLYWKSDCLDFGHFLNLYYDKKKNVIYGVSFNPNEPERGKGVYLVVFNEKSGEIIYVNSIETSSAVFVENSDGVMLLDGNGKIYTMINNQLVENSCW